MAPWTGFEPVTLGVISEGGTVFWPEIRENRFVMLVIGEGGTLPTHNILNLLAERKALEVCPVESCRREPLEPRRCTDTH